MKWWKKSVYKLCCHDHLELYQAVFTRNELLLSISYNFVMLEIFEGLHGMNLL